MGNKHEFGGGDSQPLSVCAVSRVGLKAGHHVLEIFLGVLSQCADDTVSISSASMEPHLGDVCHEGQKSTS